MLFGISLIIGLSVAGVASSPSFSSNFDAGSFAKLSYKVRGAMATSDSDVPVLIETVSQDYAPLVRLIEASGGTVGFQYRYTSSLAARIPSGALLNVAGLSSVKAIYLDEIREIADASSGPGLPGLGLGRGGAELDAGPSALDQAFLHTKTLSLEEIQEYDPEVFNLDLSNSLGTANARPRAGFGAGTTIAVIDTGIFSGHFMLAGSVVAGGGIDLSPDVGTSFEGFDKITNHWHGSHVHGIALGHGAICLPPGFLLTLSIEQHTGVTLPACSIPGLGFLKEVPLLGMAPAAKTYPIKVFPHTGAGVPESTIIAAIEHAITVKDAFGIDVISMSLGGATLFDGRDLEDRTVDKAVSAGLVVVSAAGNEGPASMTVASPGSANKGIAVGAAAIPENVRIFRDFQLGSLDAGNELFVSDDPSIISFSSRGPTADGRGKPDVVAPGVFILSACPGPTCNGGGANTIAWASGTSMSTPHVSGAALLLEAFADLEGIDATPFDIKRAILKSADDDDLEDLYSPNDYGEGLIDVDEAMDDLRASKAKFKVGLSGLQEVPPVDTDASGKAKVRLRGDDRLKFKLKVCDIEEVFAAHIHLGAFGVNGPILLTLFDGDPFSTDRCKTLSKGKLDSGDLTGPLSDWDAFVEQLRNGNTYINVHTADHGGGEIRGQISLDTELLPESVPLANIANIDFDDDDDDEDDDGEDNDEVEAEAKLLDPLNHADSWTGVTGEIEFEDDGSTLEISGAATGLTPGIPYASLIYDVASEPAGPFACEPGIFDPLDPNFIIPTMFVGFWDVDEDGNGELSATNIVDDDTGDRVYVPLDKIATISVRDLTVPGPFGPGSGPAAVVACGWVEVEDDDNGALVISDDEELEPGEALELVFPVDLHTSSIRLEIEDVDLGDDGPHGATWLSAFGFDATGQPQMNSLEVYIHGAKRGGSFFDYEIDSANVWGDAAFTVTDDTTTAAGALRLDVPIKPFGGFNARMIEPGFYKIVIENDWTSFDEIEFEFELTVESAPLPVPHLTFAGAVAEGASELFFFVVPPGLSEIVFILKWPGDWSRYPTNDLDFFTFFFGAGFLCFPQGATLNSPEKCVVEEPPATLVAIIVDGFSVPLGVVEPFSVEVFFIP